MPESIIGIDAAWTPGGSSGVALLEKEKSGALCVKKVTASYAAFVGLKKMPKSQTLPDIGLLLQSLEQLPQVVALDIPLSPQPMLGYREADRQITSRYGKKGAAVHSPTPERPGKVADHIFAELTQAGLHWAGIHTSPKDLPCFMEVYPHVSIIEYMQLEYRLPYKVQKKSKYWKAHTHEERYRRSIEMLMRLRMALQQKLDNSLDQFLPVLDVTDSYTIAYLKSYEDQLDAIVCALTAYDFLQGKVQVLGDDTSAIWIPKLST